MRTDWGLREREMAAHEWSDPHLAGIARRVVAPRRTAWWLWVVAAVLLASGWCVGWWVL